MIKQGIATYNVDTKQLVTPIEMSVGTIVKLTRNSPCSWGISQSDKTKVKDFDKDCEQGEFGIQALAIGEAIVYSDVSGNRELFKIIVK